MDEAPVLHRDSDNAEEMAANAVLQYLRECDVKGEQKKRQWIDRVFERVKAKELSH